MFPVPIRFIAFVYYQNFSFRTEGIVYNILHLNALENRIIILNMFIGEKTCMYIHV